MQSMYVVSKVFFDRCVGALSQVTTVLTLWILAASKYSTLSNRPHGSNSRHGATDSEKLIKNMDQINVMELDRW